MSAVALCLNQYLLGCNLTRSPGNIVHIENGVDEKQHVHGRNGYVVDETANKRTNFLRMYNS